MGREAYLARLALGISAFQEPLRDENGDFVLGGQARRFDNIGYVQQWDERGRPRNLASEQKAKRFYRSQNEILQACGLVVRKNAEKKRERKGDEIPKSDQLEVLREENETGFILRFFDSIAGDPLTWWVVNLKKRLLVFEPSRSTILEIFQAGLSSTHVMSFLFGGFAASTLSNLLLAARDADLEDAKYLDLLETRTHKPHVSWETRFKSWSKWLCLLSIEIPLSMISTLQNLGFTIGPAVLSYLKSVDAHQKKSLFIGTDVNVMNGLTGIMIIHLVRGRIYDEVFWRLYVMLRQVLPRPRNPSKISIQAAENDEYDDSESIVGIGRRLGSHTDRRFFGPQSAWGVFQAAFPWVGVLDHNRIDREKIKQETLTRCAMMEGDQPYHDTQRYSSARRSENIISNLESLGIDLEEDFFVDVDQWSREIDNIDTSRIWDAALQIDADRTGYRDMDQQPATSADRPVTRNRPSLTPPMLELTDNIVENADGSITIEFELAGMHDNETNWNQAAPVEILSFPTSPDNEATSTTETPASQPTTDLLQSIEEADDIVGQPNFNFQPTETMTAAHSSVDETAPERQAQHTPPASTPTSGYPLTPEPGIRRATSLTHTQTTPRPVRRNTETGDDADVEDYLAEVLAGARRLEAKKKKKDSRESRVTRVSVFASDSLAWHASSLITSLVLLPLNAAYYRKLTRWFLSMTKDLSTTVSIFPREELRLPESAFDWRQSRMVLLSVSIECLMHGIVWQVGCGLARYYGRKYHWGKF